VKTLAQQISIMQHVVDGKALIVRNLDGTINNIILDTSGLTMFDWTKFDYDKYVKPRKFWIKIINAKGKAIVFKNKAEFETDTTVSLIEGRFFKLGREERKILKRHNMIDLEDVK